MMELSKFNRKNPAKEIGEGTVLLHGKKTIYIFAKNIIVKTVILTPSPIFIKFKFSKVLVKSFLKVLKKYKKVIKTNKKQVLCIKNEPAQFSFLYESWA